MLDERPVLYSFRRCPFAMRARWALWVAQVQVEHREIVLRDKPVAMLAASPKGTVPVLVLPSGEVIDESLDVMRWALARHDPEGWLSPTAGTLAQMLNLIDACQQDFKPHLDRSKYPQRHAAEWGGGGGTDAHDAASRMALFVAAQHGLADQFLAVLEARLSAQPALFGARPGLADFAIAPFVRQYARADAARWGAATWVHLPRWFEGLLARPEFEAEVMHKHPVWQPA